MVGPVADYDGWISYKLTQISSRSLYPLQACYLRFYSALWGFEPNQQQSLSLVHDCIILAWSGNSNSLTWFYSFPPPTHFAEVSIPYLMVVESPNVVPKQSWPLHPNMVKGNLSWCGFTYLRALWREVQQCPPLHFFSTPLLCTSSPANLTLCDRSSCNTQDALFKEKIRNIFSSLAVIWFSGDTCWHCVCCGMTLERLASRVLKRTPKAWVDFSAIEPAILSRRCLSAPKLIILSNKWRQH